MRRVKRFTLKRAQTVVVNSTATQAACQKLWPGKEYPIIPMGIDIDKFNGNRLSSQANGYRILFVGRLARSKGLRYLCEAMKLLSVRYGDVRLDIVGDGPERVWIAQYVEDNHLGNIITVHGWVQPELLPDNYLNADVFIGPSSQETGGTTEALGLVFAEASAAGLPVVATDVGGIKDIVKDKVTGLLVPQKDPQALCIALAYLHDHRKEGELMGTRGRVHVAANFSWEGVTRRYLEILEGEVAA
jgi:glycosyltransferase involved in cell wall biosynthesis